jgi:predicted DNA-binding protein
MGEIVLRSDLHETLEKDAKREARSVNEIVNEAIERYLHERQIAQLDAEIAAFEKLHPELRQKHLGQWVAVHEQELVDHDSDRAALYKRVRATYGRTAVLIRQVTEQPDNEIWIRTPSTGKVEQ